MRPPAPPATAPPRRRPLTRGLVGCVLAVSLVGCGTSATDGDASRATDSSSAPDASAPTATSEAPTPTDDATPTGPGSSGPSGSAAEPRLVELVSITAAGGTVTATPTPVAGEAARAAYLAEFDARARGRLRRAFAAVEAPRADGLAAAVVAVGCVPPEDVWITSAGTARNGRTYEVSAAASKTPDVQCFAPVTTVAVLLLPA